MLSFLFSCPNARIFRSIKAPEKGIGRDSREGEFSRPSYLPGRFSPSQNERKREKEKERERERVFGMTSFVVSDLVQPSVLGCCRAGVLAGSNSNVRSAAAFPSSIRYGAGRMKIRAPLAAFGSALRAESSSPVVLSFFSLSL